MQQPLQLHHVDATTFDVPPSLHKCQQELRQIQRTIRKLERTASTIRRTEQEDLYQCAIKNGDTKTANALKYCILAEQKKSMFQKLKAIKSATKSSLT